MLWPPDVSNWEGEVSAWGILCADLRRAADDGRARAKECVSQRDAAIKETASLEERLLAAREEVGQLHAIRY